MKPFSGNPVWPASTPTLTAGSVRIRPDQPQFADTNALQHSRVADGVVHPRSACGATFETLTSSGDQSRPLTTSLVVVPQRAVPQALIPIIPPIVQRVAVEGQVLQPEPVRGARRGQIRLHHARLTTASPNSGSRDLIRFIGGCRNQGRRPPRCPRRTSRRPAS